MMIFCRHRVCNIFARTYFERWLQEEDIGQEALIEDLTVSFNDQYFKDFCINC